MVNQVKYHVQEFENSFLVRGGEYRTPFKVTMDQCRWILEDLDGCFHGFFGLYEISKMATQAAKIALRNWEPKNTPMQSFYKNKWGPEKLAKVLGKILSSQFKRLKGTIAPAILDVQRAIFSSTFACGNVATSMSFYRYASNFLLSDIRRFRPAAVAARHLFTNWGPECFSLERKTAKTLKELFDNCTSQPPIVDFDPLRKDCNNKPELMVSFNEYFYLLEKWPLLYAPSRKPYTALNRTLSNCPKVPPRILLKVFKHRLERPLHEKYNFLITIEALDSEMAEENRKVFLNSTKDEIRDSLKDLQKEIGPTFYCRKSTSIGFLVNYINDSNEINPNGNLRNLLKKAIRWHRHNQGRPKFRRPSVDMSMEVKKPPVVFPETVDGLKIHFLDTIGKIYSEGEDMNHCIGTFVDKAMEGKCYLFHVEDLKSGEKASVEMDMHGKVVQSRGPYNCSNKASVRGESVLAKLGKEIRDLSSWHEEDLGTVPQFDDITLPF